MRDFLRRLNGSASFRLAVTYLAIIMSMSIGFSVVFYYTSSHELGRQAPPAVGQLRQPDDGFSRQPRSGTVETFLANRAREGRHELFIRLLGVNGAALVLGSALSYVLARRALRPIEQSMEAQAQFVSDASHELRTPLTAIQASNEVALRSTQLTLAQARQVIHGNSQEAVKLQHLSEGLLNLARQDAKATQLTAVNLQDTVVTAINTVIPAAQVKQIVIDDLLPDSSVNATQQGLEQVLIILLDNAIKYGRRGGQIRLTASSKGKFTIIQVADNGPGIRASDLPHIFRRFYRADSARSDSHSQGYGLGLAIAQAIVQQFGGSLSVDSEIGKGSTFFIKLSTP